MGMYENTYPSLSYNTLAQIQARLDPNHVRVRIIIMNFILLLMHAPMHMYYYHLLSCNQHNYYSIHACHCICC